MKKKLLEKDIFYLSLFICVCLVAFGGILFTNKNLNKLVASKDTINKDNEINLVKEKNDSVPTSTESKENLEKAKEQNNKKTETKSESKLNYIGTEVLRQYSTEMPSYSKTLDVWEIHKGLDVAAEDGAEPPGPRACPHGAARLFGTAALGAPGAQGAAAQGVFVPPYPRAAAGHPEAGGAYGSSFQTQRHSAPQAAQSLPGDALHPLRAGAGADARGAAQKEKIKWIFPFLPARGGIFLHGTANPVAFLWRIVYNGSTNSVKFSRKQGKLFLEFLKWVQ